jgi:hypothetical protein
MPPTPALQLHAITLADGNQSSLPVPGGKADKRAVAPVPGTPGEKIAYIAFRELCAVVSEQMSFTLNEATPADVDRHRAIVDDVFRHGAVLPAPMGAVFRTPDVLKRWMELHYVSLTDALEFVEDRAVARVHVVRADGKPDELDAGSDLAAAATESFRALRRRAVSAVPLRVEKVTGLMLSGAFLVERDLWKDFEHAVAEQQDAHHLLSFDVTGPWAPYDFVRMQFGG